MGARFEIEPAEYADGIEGLQLWGRRRIGQRGCQIEALDAGPEVGWIQADDFGVVSRRLGQKIVVRRQQIREPHPVVIRVAARTKYMALQINRLLVV